MKKAKSVFGVTGAVLVCALFVSGCQNKAALAYGALQNGALQKSTNAAGTLSVLLPESAKAAPEAPSAEAKPVSQPVFAAAEMPVNPIEIKEKMFIAQTNDVYLNPEDYLGKGIKLEGLFKREGYGQEYCFVIRYGPGCCGNDGNAGFEVAWDGEYPNEDEWVEAIGVLQTYEEDGYPYLYIALASLTVLDERGAEFVTQ
ncbi:MAG: hypothetical protein LBH73_07825 [Spirochaetaceae bacterium]|jgi:uncharacterized membrane protein YcgQ (UPF0703/DUF1980 family)|nr:hypothetical protein [Spirochaetaceae bacterium]